MAVENLANSLGSPGRFQIILYIMLCCNSFFVCWNHLAMAFMAAKTTHHCAVNNVSSIDIVIPLQNKPGAKSEWDGCYIYVNVSAKEKEPCPNGWTYYLKDREATIISEVK